MTKEEMRAELNNLRESLVRVGEDAFRWQAERDAAHDVLREIERRTSVGPPSPPGRKLEPRHTWYDLLVSVNALAKAAARNAPAPAAGREGEG